MVPGFAQESSLRTIWVPTQQDSVKLDSLPIYAPSFQLENADTSDYRLLPIKSLLVWRNKPQADSVKATFRVLFFDLGMVVKNKDTTLLEPDYQEDKNPFKFSAQSQETDNYSFSQLQKQGSISRGLSFGNNQNLGVNSNLNLQLSGKITEEVSIMAAISDNNIPIQPEGNTQQLQDFDQVYIQLYNDNNRLTAGDFQITNDESHFLRYNKRLRGATFQTRFKTADNDSAAEVNIQASAAVSRGKFARNIVQGVEGNQGPYRLTGEENEAFIIVLSGTERIYIDGQLLTRGQDNDYVIDYNKAEVTFTAKQLITKDKRIIIEFQYTAQTYARSLLQSSVSFKKDKWNIRFDGYSEQDAKNQPLQQDLTDEQKEQLSQIGDNINNAFVSGAQIVDYDNDRVLYKLTTDTLSNGEVDSIFVYSTQPDSAIYQVSFSDVGLLNGNYIQAPSSANGRVYEYIEPVNGIPQGSFSPVIVLVTPKLRQMFNVAGQYQIGRNTFFTSELALTQNDINTFSNEDSGNDIGYAGTFRLETEQAVGKKKNPWVITAAADFEQLSQDFSRIERFRKVEFDRNWNIRDLTLTKAQYLPGAEVGIKNARNGKTLYRFQGFFAGEEFNANRHQLIVDMRLKRHEINYNASLMNATGELNNAQFFRHKTLYKKRFKHFNIGYRDDLERNLRRDPTSDSLSNAAYQFLEFEFFIENPDSAVNRYKAIYNQRWDYGADSNEIKAATRGESVGFEFELKKNRNSQLKGKAVYRELQVLNNDLYSGDPENTVLGRLEYTLRLLKGGLTSTSFYEIASGLEEEQEFVYIEVANGQGVYSWTDYNDNNIKELDEFEVAAFQDQANYIRVFTRTNEFVRTYSNQFNQTLFFRPELIWRQKTGFKKFVARFSDQVAFRVNRKTNREEGFERFNPFTNAILDSNIITLNSSLRNTVYFNRTHPTFGIEHTMQALESKSLLSNGTESRTQRFQKTDIRYNITQAFQWNVIGEEGVKSNTSEFFSSRNFNITYYSVEPKFTYQPGAAFNVSLAYSVTEKQNSPDLGNENAFIQKATLSGQRNKVGKSSITISASLIDIDYSANSGNALAFEMLEGLQNGRNGTWEVFFQKNLGEFLQLNLSYNGRISESAPVVHAGNVQLRAFF